MIEDEIKDHRSGIIKDEFQKNSEKEREEGAVEMVGGDRSTLWFLSLQKERKRERDKLTMRDIFGTDGMRLCAYISLCYLYTLTARALPVARLSFLFFCRNVFCVFQLLWNYKIKINK